MRRAEHHSRALQTVVAAVVIAALICAAALSTFLPANDDSLRVQLGALESSISEALTLARADDERTITRSFFDTELDLLRQDVSGARSALLSSRPLPELRGRFEEAARLAASAEGALHAVATPGARAESVIAGQATLGAIRERVNAMEQELQPPPHAR